MTGIKLSSPKLLLSASAKRLRPYVGVMIFMLFAAVYGYTLFQINSLSAPTVNESDVLSEAKTLPAPRIDSDAANQLLTLKDNSVNVQALFEKSRTNPFQE